MAKNKVTAEQKEARQVALHKAVRDMVSSGKDLDAHGVPELPALKQILGFGVPKPAVIAVTKAVRTAMGLDAGGDSGAPGDSAAAKKPGKKGPNGPAADMVYPTLLYKQGAVPQKAVDAKQAERLYKTGYRSMDDYAPEEKRAVYESLPAR